MSPLSEVSASRSPFSGEGLTAGEVEVISIFVQMAQVVGLSRSLGEIYGLLFATPQPLAFQEIADRLELSKGSVSQGLKFLRTIGAIKPVEVSGDRREFFEPVVELRALVSGFLKERLNPQLEEWGKRAKALKIEDFERAGAGVERPEAGNLKPEGGDGKPETGNLKSEGGQDSSEAQVSSFKPQVSALSGLRSQVSGLPLEKSHVSGLPFADHKTLSGRLDKLKTWQKRANTVLPMIGKLLG